MKSLENVQNFRLEVIKQIVIFDDTLLIISLVKMWKTSCCDSMYIWILQVVYFPVKRCCPYKS